MCSLTLQKNGDGGQSSENLLKGSGTTFITTIIITMETIYFQQIFLQDLAVSTSKVSHDLDNYFTCTSTSLLSVSAATSSCIQDLLHDNGARSKFPVNRQADR